MLKLDRLDLSGFKSFVDPVSVDFAGRMTSIVGPNGCGKSNLSDAVVWVLGERSAKTLRGDKMEDVIFSGSSGRKPLGMAEVQLSFTADADFEGADDHRLTIGRRLYRDGASQYLLNGKRTRLKEIRDTLMDTGLGIRAYSVIEQGKIGLILSGKPQERRRLLEEAAGITRYKERRRIAEVKLEESRANLSRLDDIISEVERALRSLKRQASAAQRLQKRKGEHDDLLRQALLGRWFGLSTRLAELREAKEVQVTRESELATALSTEEADLAKGRETLEELSKHLAEQHRSDSDLAARIEGKQEFLKGAKHRLEELEERIATGIARKEGFERRIVDLGERMTGLVGTLESLTGERDGAASIVDQDDQKIDAVQKAVADSEQDLESLRTRLLSSLGEVTSTRNLLHREQLEHEKGLLRKAHLEEELVKKTEILETTRQDCEAATAKLERLERENREASETGAQLTEQKLAAERSEAEASEKAHRLAKEVETIERRIHLLEELGRAQQARRREVTEALADAGISESLSFLAERLNVPEGWERSLDLYLGELADAVVLPSGESGLGVAQTLTSGKGTFRLLASSPAVAAPALDDPAVLQSLGEAVGLPADLQSALPPAFLVASADDAERLAGRNPGIAFISKDRLWAQSGLVHVQGSQASPGQLGREQELARLTEQLPPLQTESEKAAEALEAARVAHHDAREKSDKHAVEIARIRQEHAVAAARHEDVTGRERRLALEHETLGVESEDVVHQLTLISGRTEGLTTGLSEADAAHASLEASFDEAQKQVDGARAERETVRTSGAGRRGQLELIEARLDAQRQESARLEAEVGDSRRQISFWEEEFGSLSKRKSELGEAQTAAETELQKALEDREEILGKILKEQGAVDTKRSELKTYEERLEAARTTRDEVREEISQHKVKEAAIGQDVEHLAGQFREAFEEDLPETATEPTRPLDEIEVDLERCRHLIDRIGPVNLLAAKEFEEQTERFTFLTTQRADVADSVTSLQKTIQEINETSSERFLAAFTEVNEYFGKTFQELFRGGEAEMRLMDEDDPLESGIEIVARPPGKRLQNIMLMSGGEKALTAIALLFGLFHTKPSPFCILDEVDAPLDDVNTMRFVELLKKRSAHTQFIVVTHNKITMEAASTLYGVTMQEPGVSSLVTVELDDLVSEDEQAATA